MTNIFIDFFLFLTNIYLQNMHPHRVLTDLVGIWMVFTPIYSLKRYIKNLI